MAVRWYLRYGLSYRDVEELLAERGVSVDHVTVYRWVPTVHTRVRRSGTDTPSPARWPLVRRRDLRQGQPTMTYLYRAIDQYGQVIDERLSDRRAQSEAATDAS